MEPKLYADMVDYKVNGVYPDGLDKKQKNAFRRKIKTFSIEGKNISTIGIFIPITMLSVKTVVSTL